MTPAQELAQARRAAAKKYAADLDRFMRALKAWRLLGGRRPDPPIKPAILDEDRA